MRSLLSLSYALLLLCSQLVHGYINDDVGLITQISYDNEHENAIFSSGEKSLATAIEILLPENFEGAFLHSMRILRHDTILVEHDLRFEPLSAGLSTATYFDMARIDGGSILVLRNADTGSLPMNDADVTCNLCETGHDCSELIEDKVRRVHHIASPNFKLTVDFTVIELVMKKDVNAEEGEIFAQFGQLGWFENEEDILYPMGDLLYHTAATLSVSNGLPSINYKSLIDASTTLNELPFTRNFGKCLKPSEFTYAPYLRLQQLESELDQESNFDFRKFWKISLTYSVAEDILLKLLDSPMWLRWLPQDPNFGGYFMHIAGPAYNDVNNHGFFYFFQDGECVDGWCKLLPVELAPFTPTLSSNIDELLVNGGMLSRIVLSERLVWEDYWFEDDVNIIMPSRFNVIDSVDFPFITGKYTTGDSSILYTPMLNPWARGTDTNVNNNEPLECNMRRNSLTSQFAVTGERDMQGQMAAGYCNFCGPDSCCCARLNDYFNTLVQPASSQYDVCSMKRIDERYNFVCDSNIDTCSTCESEECCYSLSQNFANPTYCYWGESQRCISAPDTCVQCSDIPGCCAGLPHMCLDVFEGACVELPDTCSDCTDELCCQKIEDDVGCVWSGGVCELPSMSCDDCNEKPFTTGCCFSNLNSSDGRDCHIAGDSCFAEPEECDSCNLYDLHVMQDCCKYGGYNCFIQDDKCETAPITCSDCIDSPNPESCCASNDEMACIWAYGTCIADNLVGCSQCNAYTNKQGCCDSRDYCVYYQDPDNTFRGTCQTRPSSCESCNYIPFVDSCCESTEGCILLGKICQHEDFDFNDICENYTLGAVSAISGASIGLIALLCAMIAHWILADGAPEHKEYLELDEGDPELPDWAMPTADVKYIGRQEFESNASGVTPFMPFADRDYISRGEYDFDSRGASRQESSAPGTVRSMSEYSKGSNSLTKSALSKGLSEGGSRHGSLRGGSSGSFNRGLPSTGLGNTGTSAYSYGSYYSESEAPSTITTALTGVSDATGVTDLTISTSSSKDLRAMKSKEERKEAERQLRESQE